MRYSLFGNSTDALTIALLVKDSSFIIPAIKASYVDYIINAGISHDNIIAFTLDYFGTKKVSAKLKKEYLATLLAEINKLNIRTIYVTDAEYFKTLIGKNQKIDSFYGYVLPCAISGYEHIQVILGVNYQAMAYNPALQDKLQLSLNTLIQYEKGSYTEPGKNVIKYAQYYDDPIGISYALEKLKEYPELTTDIEGFSLKFYDCGIATISFAWDEHNGISICCDYTAYEIPLVSDDGTFYGYNNPNPEIRKLLKTFFESYTGKLTYHNGNFDMKVLVYTLWMYDLGDYVGMHAGIDCLGRNFDDTKIITYLATNNVVDTPLSLKILGQEFAGNYAQDNINDIRLIEKHKLLEYNLVDSLTTWYVKNKYLPIMISENQQQLYDTLFKPSITLLLQIELVGMPIDPNKVAEAKIEMTAIAEKHMAFIQKSPIVKDFHYTQLMLRVDKDNAKLKTKKRIIEDFADVKFNPNSDQQLAGLLYDYLGYEVIDKTKSGAPATGSKTLTKLLNYARNEEHTELIENFIGLTKVTKILTSFIPAFENNSRQLPNGDWRLYGNFNLGGTQSGRLSSSDPNLQNIPSGSTYATIIKHCFISPKGFLFGGADFHALEAVCEALQSKDPNKLKVYTDGYDSHCVNAYAYFKDQMPDIIDSVESINSIKDKYPKLRKKSKAPTFALQYKGTWRTIMKSAGVSAEMAKSIERNYFLTYAVSIEWLDNILDEAHKTGYIEGAFGLKVRTPTLVKTPLKGRMPYAAAEERRSAGNSKTQSYGLLNNRAACEFRDRVNKSPYRYDIFLVSLIHDATYVLFRDEIHIAKWVNDNLIDCMRWQELPELQHDIVKLGAELDIYWPTWADALTLPNDTDTDTIQQLAIKHKQKVMSHE